MVKFVKYASIFAQVCIFIEWTDMRSFCIIEKQVKNLSVTFSYTAYPPYLIKIPQWQIPIKSN